MRLIDADELIEELIKCESSIYPITSELILGVKSGYRKAIVQVEHAPTIEAEPVKHASDYPCELYPLTIVWDRYGGVYSEGEFTAWNLEPENVPKEIDADDVTCLNFWHEYRKTGGIVGLGATPEAAIDDLIAQCKRSGAKMDGGSQ